MSGTGNRAVDGGRSDRARRFVMTLIVSTGMAAASAWALSYAVLAPDRVGAHGQTAASQHARS